MTDHFAEKPTRGGSQFSHNEDFRTEGWESGIVRAKTVATAHFAAAGRLLEAASESAVTYDPGSRRTAADPVGGNSRENPVRLELQRDILAYVEAAGIAGEAKDRPQLRATNGWTRKPTEKALRTERICERVKRRLKDAGLPCR